jgi:serine/threonine protein kinase
MDLKRWCGQAAEAMQTLAIYRIFPNVALRHFGLYQDNDASWQLMLADFVVEPCQAEDLAAAQHQGIVSFFQGFLRQLLHMVPALQQADGIVEAQRAHQQGLVKTYSQLIKLLGNQHRHPVTGLPHEISWSKLSFVRQLGSGEFGECNLMALRGAQDRQVLVAVKTLVKEDCEEEFVKEMDLLERLDDVNLVKLFHVITLEEPKALVMEYLAGGMLCQWWPVLQCGSSVVRRVGDLQHWLLGQEGKKVAESDRLFILSQVAAGLHALHENNIVHRDLVCLTRVLTPEMC